MECMLARSAKGQRDLQVAGIFGELARSSPLPQLTHLGVSHPPKKSTQIAHLGFPESFASEFTDRPSGIWMGFPCALLLIRNTEFPGVFQDFHVDPQLAVSGEDEVSHGERFWDLQIALSGGR